MALILPGDLKADGIDQVSLFNWISNCTDIVNELQTDHATNIAVVAANKAAVNAVIAAAATTSATLAAVGSVTAVTLSAAATLTNSTALTLLRS